MVQEEPIEHCAAPSVATEGILGQLVAPVLLKFIVSYSFDAQPLTLNFR